jgi:hypothetical protein
LFIRAERILLRAGASKARNVRYAIIRERAIYTMKNRVGDFSARLITIFRMGMCSRYKE